MYFENCKYDQSFNKPCKLKNSSYVWCKQSAWFYWHKKKKTEETAEKTSKYTMGRGAAFDGPFIKIHLTMLFDRQYMRVLMGLTVSRKICSWIVSIIVWMCSSTSAPGFDEKAGDSSNSERLHFTKASTFRTTTVTYEQQISIKKVKWYQRDNYVFMFFHEPFCNQAFSCLFVSGSCLLMFILNFFFCPTFSCV